MTEKPILYNTAMVRAIIAGIKTQTRRVVKRVRSLGEPGEWCHKVDRAQFAEMVGDYRRFCPYGQPGETRLWVRETWTPNDCECEGPCRHPHYAYLADPWTDTVMPVDHPRWRPSIHMPRRASRLTLELTAVRVERLQDITDDDAFAEGVLPNWQGPRAGLHTAPSGAAFASLWEAINGPRGFGWDVNPWVWVLAFNVVKQEAKPC